MVEVEQPPVEEMGDPGVMEQPEDNNGEAVGENEGGAHEEVGDFNELVKADIINLYREKSEQAGM